MFVAFLNFGAHRRWAAYRKIGELRSMRKALADLVERCHGDSRPDCPILDDLGETGQIDTSAVSRLT